MEGFFPALCQLCKSKSKDIVEKDYHLHRLLFEISENTYLRSRLIFKGGTCLVKAYTGYYRFSEDIDFTIAQNDAYDSMSNSAIDTQCSKEATSIIAHFKTITDRVGLRFSGVKTGADVHMSSGGRMINFTPQYYSELNKDWIQVKIELNFFDITIYPTRSLELKTYLNEIESKELEFLYEEQYQAYSKKVVLNCYDSKEIFIEKCRAMMTRRTYKPRDVLDIYMMEKKFGYSVNSFEKEIVQKVKFAIETYSRYSENINIIDFPSPENISFDDNNLLLIDNPGDLEISVVQIHKDLERIRQKIIKDVA